MVDKSFWAIDSLDDLEEKWPKMAESRPQLIKVIVVDDAHRGEQRKGPTAYGFRGLNTELVPEIVAQANQIGARVAAHVDSADDIDRIVRAGVHIIAHMNTRIPEGLTASDMRLSDETIAVMKRREPIIIPTVAVARYHLQARPENREPLFTIIRDNLTRLKAAGIPMFAGSDLFKTNSIRHGNPHLFAASADKAAGW